MQIYQFYPNNNKKQATTPKKNKLIVRQIIMSLTNALQGSIKLFECL